ncbi:MAG: oligosaccharide flippase family protein [Nitrososphaeria archaeon]|nr:oligosaccharide flippase family protein [Nitrososphaeria archaeon]
MSQPAGRLFDVADESVRGGLALFIGDSISTIILALGSILIARFLGPEGYGLYSITFAVPTLMLSFISLGIDQAVIRFPARLRVEGKLDYVLSFLKSAITFRFTISLVTWLICFLLSDVFAVYFLNRPEIGFYIKISSFIIIAQSFFTLVYNIFIGLDASERSTAIKILMSIVKSTLAPILILVGLGIAGAVTAHVLSFTIASLSGIVILYLNQYKKMKSVVRVDQLSNTGFSRDLRLMIGYGLPLWLSSLMLILVDQYRLVILARSVSDLEIGNFQAAGNFLALLAVISTPIALALFPAFSKLEPESEDVRKAFQYSVKYTAMILAPASVFTMMMSRFLVEIIYGDEYTLAPLFLSLYAAMFLYSAFGSTVLGNFFNGIGETKVNLKATILYVALFIPSATVLTYLYGVLGLISSILVSLIVNVFYYIHVAMKRYDLRIDLQASARILLASWISGFTLIPLLLNTWLPSYLTLLLGIIIYTIIYITLLPLVKCLEKIDLENLNLLFKRYKFLRPIIDFFIKYESRLILLTKDIS